MNIEDIEKSAKIEIAQERFRNAVNQKKSELARAKWWHRLMPFTVSIKINRRK